MNEQSTATATTAAEDSDALALAEKAHKRKQLERVATVVVLVAALLFPVFESNAGNVDAAANACAFAVLALGLNVVVGFAGLLDLGYAAFFAIGAYFYGVITSWQITPQLSAVWKPFIWMHLAQAVHSGGTMIVHFTPSFWLMLPIAALVAAGFGMLFGYPTLRLKGDYLAIVTLGFGEIVPIVARNVPSVTNGAAGLNGVAPPQLFGFDFGVTSTPYYYVGLALVVLLIFASVRLRDSRIGRAWIAIREDEIAAGAMGVDRRRLKLAAFATGAAFAGMAGAFYIAKLQTATPDMFMFPVSVMILVMVVLGGMGSVWGVVVGAILLQLLQSWFLPDLTLLAHWIGDKLSNPYLQNIQLASAGELIFGLILVFMMLYRRGGLIPATRGTAALSFSQQNVTGPSRGGIREEALREHFTGLTKQAQERGVPVLETRKLCRSFGGLDAVKDVDFQVEPGSIVAIIGPNGAGKTTLFNLVTGLDAPTGGQVLFEGDDVTGLQAHQMVERGIARTFQNLRLFWNMTLLDNALVATHTRTRCGLVGAVVRSRATRAEEQSSREWAMQVLSVFGNRLLPRVNHMAHTLSYANRRRLEIARAVAARPHILLLDEPTAGMNPAETLELADQIRSLRDMGLTIVLIEHKLNVVNDIADKVVVLDHGVKIAEGTPEEVHANEHVIEAYLGRGHAAAAA